MNEVKPPEDASGFFNGILSSELDNYRAQIRRANLIELACYK